MISVHTIIVTHLYSNEYIAISKWISKAMLENDDVFDPSLINVLHNLKTEIY